MATPEKMEDDMTEVEEAMKVTEDSDSSDSLDESSSESEESDDEVESKEMVADVDELEKQIAALQTEIDANPYIYNKHTQLISTLRSRGDAARLRAARERMSALFPLSEDLWLEWLQDEAESDHRSELLERAVADYASVKVWMEYVYHSMRGIAEPDGIENVRKTFEKAVDVVGLNVAKGTTVWEAYREFELAVLAGVQPPPGSTQTSDFEAQMNRVTRLFKRQLSIPLSGMDATFREYKAWIEGDVDVETQKGYDEAHSILGKLKPYEDLLVQSDPPHIDVYNKYIAFEMTIGNSSRIQCLFERAIEENCLVADLWLRYVEFLEDKVKSSNIILPIYRRSVRNCPWAAELWVGQLRAMEMCGKSKEEIKATFNEALCAGFTQGSEYLQLWTAYIDFLRRCVDWKTEHKSQLEELRNAFEDAINQLYQSYPVDGDPKCCLTKYWAFIEAKFCHNMAKSRELWTQIIQSGYDSDCQTWLEYIQLERAFGDVKHCRKVLQRALSSVHDWPEAICEKFLQFEREEGDLVHFQMASSLCKEKMKQVEETRAKEAKRKEKSVQKKKVKTGAKWEKPSKDLQTGTKLSEQQMNLKPYQSSKKSKKQNLSEMQNNLSDSNYSESIIYVRGSAQQKRKLDEMSCPAIPPEAALVLDKEGFKIPPPPPLGEPQKSPLPVNPPPGFSGTVGSPRNNSSTTASAALGSVVGTEDSEEGAISEPPHKRMRGDHSERKSIVFISNLDYSISEEQIKQVFSKIGKIKEVQLAMSGKTHTSRGFGHIEFIDELAVVEALKLDRTLIEGRPVFVSKFEPEESKRSKFRYDVGLEKKKLFVRGLPVSYTEEQIQKEFSQHGKVNAVRLVTYRNGKSKGLAYIEYETEDSASQAVLKMDGQTFGDSKISVAISNPPARNAPAAEQLTFVPSLGGGKRDNKHAAAKTQLSLVPRAIQRNVTSSAGKNTAAAANGVDENKPQQPKTNADFRNMLLKK